MESNPHAEGAQSTGAQISDGAAQLVREYTGHGPTKARTIVSDDLVTIVMGGSLSTGEQTLIEEGDGGLVLEVRRRFQQAMRAHRYGGGQDRPQGHRLHERSTLRPRPGRPNFRPRGAQLAPSRARDRAANAGLFRSAGFEERVVGACDELVAVVVVLELGTAAAPPSRGRTPHDRHLASYRAVARRGLDEPGQWLGARVEHLDAALELLQDAVYRQAVAQDESIGELRKRTEPEQMARDFSRDARRRGL